MSPKKMSSNKYLMRFIRPQRGAALIAAIFVITALAGLGGLMTQRLMLSTEETINEWYSGQALAAAESGIQWAIWDLANDTNGSSSPPSPGTGVTADSGDTNRAITNSSWMSTTVTIETINTTYQTYTITSVGKAGGTAANPRTRRQISVKYIPH